MNQNNNIYSIALADDLLIHVASKWTDIIQNKLEKLVIQVNDMRDGNYGWLAEPQSMWNDTHKENNQLPIWTQ